MKRLVFGAAALVSMGLAASPALAVDELVFAADYDSPQFIGAGISVVGSDVGDEDSALNPIGGWSGMFNNTSTTELGYLTLSNLPTHTGVSASFIIGFMNSWDSYDGCCGFASDHLNFFIDGNLVATMTYNNALGSVKDIDDGTLLSEYGQHGAGGYYSDTLVDMTGASFLNFAHSGNTLTLGIQAGGSGWQGGSDESWGIDDIKVTLLGVERPGAVPEPGTWAMMLAGFGAAGLAMRRRRTAMRVSIA